MEDARISTMRDDVNILQHLMGMVRVVVEETGIGGGGSKEQSRCQDTLDKHDRVGFGRHDEIGGLIETFSV